MEEDKKTNTDKAANDASHNAATTPENTSPPVSQKNEEPVHKKPDTATKEEDTSDINKETRIVIVNEQKDGWTIANKIAFGGVFISLVLGVFTYLLFRKTVEANTISSSSLREAARANDIAAEALDNFRQRTVQEDSLNSIQLETSRIKDSTFMELTQQSLETQINSIKENQKQFEINNKKDSISLELSRQTVQAQITSLKETQKQFEIVNKAYIAVSYFKADTLAIGKRQQVSIKIKNIGKTPIIVYWTNAYLGFDTIANPIDLIATKNQRYLNYILPPDKDMEIPFMSFIPSKWMYDGVITGRHFFYVIAKVGYFDYATNKSYVYFISMRILPNGHIQPTPNNNRSTEVTGVPGLPNP